MATSHGDVTSLLAVTRNGDQDAPGKLIPLGCEELPRLAGQAAEDAGSIVSPCLRVR